jgi:hypothetical protein
MPGTTIARGNELYDFIIQPSTLGLVAGTLTWSTASLGATTTSELTTTIPGLVPGDLCDLYLNVAMTTGLTISNVRVSALNTLAVTWINSTGGSLTIPTGVWSMNITRPEAPGNLPLNAN